jgi:two-component system sensor histidine kinase CpxA
LRLPLFWRIYLGFLSVLFFPMALFSLSSLVDRGKGPEPPPGLSRLLSSATASLAPKAARLLASPGKDLETFLVREGKTRGIELFLLQGRPPRAISPLPEGVRAEEFRDLPSAAATEGERVLQGDHSLAVLVPLKGRDAVWLVGMLPPFRRPPPLLPFPPFPLSPPEMLLLLMVLGGTLCFLFVRWFSRPLRELRRITIRLARGDFSGRAGEAVTGRGDEIAELGVAFNGMAQRIEELLSSQRRLLGDISHELRSPLQRLDVAAALVREGSTPEQAAYLDRIEMETGRMNELIGGLLVLTREELGEGPPGDERIDWAEMLGQIVGDAEFEGRREGKRVRVAEFPAVAEFRGRADLLGSALENLVRNALRHTAPNTEVEIRGTEDEGGLRISVRDHGPGLPEQEMERIFRPFYRVDPARDRKTGGVGLGLSIADRAVRLHGGSIRALNAPGGGLIVEILLPGG